MKHQTGCGETLRKGRKPPRRGIHVPQPHPCLPKSHLGDFILLSPLPESVDAASFIPCWCYLNVDSTLCTIASWKYIIKSDLMCAFYQTLLSKVTMKYCGVATLFRGIRVYTKVIHGNAWLRDYCGNIIVASWATSSRRDVTAKLADVCLPQINDYRGWNFFARCTLS